ncbi:hypothetical protein [Marinobacterium jannaschii]|uniref:hypothetical protein n=1 Tax=Marinobacterium jannaschii TaxID=64970 RepID=UPI0004879646|nr:hypothetical protein [Marinobacterium jannaschii]
MKNVAIVFALASAIFTGAASAGAFGYGNSVSVEQSQLGSGVEINSNTHFVSKEQVELSSFSDSSAYNPELYTQH